MARQSDTQRFGGNLVRSVGSETRILLADDAYRYEIVPLAAGATHRVEGLATGAAWLLSGRAEVAGSAEPIEIGPGRPVLFGGDDFSLRGVGAERAVLLVAGTTHAPEGISDGVVIPDDVKHVTKPWGGELWINGRHPTFAFKRIDLNAGHRTSLQYHELKRETNLLVEGEALLHYADDEGVFDPPYHTARVSAMTTIDVWPRTLHRIEAVTDVTLFEVSTPHLDDVIRVQDDANRVDGLIESEHGVGPSGETRVA